MLVTLAAGCRHTEGIRFRYRTHDGTESERSVEPLRIVHTGRRWYLVASNRQAWRTFRVDRITLPELTGSRYENPRTRSSWLPKAPESLRGTSSAESASRPRLRR
ncbi:hypothetical protein GCM10022235_32950 [Kribbella ginsengisoli]|uniref:WYL domain-containing protein n=1 Tax=Kribbella ginsengisoli TaxID=363865 RepID=A0ABP6X5Q9_9ACTN